MHRVTVEVLAQGQLREMEATMRQEVEKAGSWQFVEAGNGGLSVMIRQQTWGLWGFNDGLRMI